MFPNRVYICSASSLVKCVSYTVRIPIRFSLIICGMCSHLLMSPDILPLMFREANFIFALGPLWLLAVVLALRSKVCLPLGFAWDSGLVVWFSPCAVVRASWCGSCSCGAPVSCGRTWFPLLRLCVLSSGSRVLLGSAILPPSRVPEQNPIVLYVVHPCLSSASVWLPPHSWTYHLCHLFHYYHLRSLSS